MMFVTHLVGAPLSSAAYSALTPENFNNSLPNCGQGVISRSQGGWVTLGTSTVPGLP
jgi:hypothetical protein